MSNLHLVTGHAGKTHVTAADHGSLYAALFGSGTYLLDKGSKFSASIISDNLVRIADGDLLMQGRHIRIPDNEYVEVVISSGTQGYKRSDLIVARYTKNEDTGVEEADIVVLIGEPIAASPQDPAYITGDIITGGALTNDVPLFRVNLDGTTITGLDSLLPAEIPVMPERIEDVRTELIDLVNNSASFYIETGTYTGTGKYGSSNPSSLTFQNDPKLLIITGEKNFIVCICSLLTTSYANYAFSCTTENGKDCYAKKSGKTVYWYATMPAYQCQSSGTVYKWFALC